MIGPGVSNQMKRLFACFSSLFFLCCTVQAQDSPASQATRADSPEIQQFQKLEDTWALAINNRDQYALELALSPLYVDIASTGEVTTRNQQVAEVLRNQDKTLHIEQKVITVRMLGDLAVINGTYTQHHRAGSAQVDEKGVFTHLFQRLHGGWVCINSQRTALRNETDPKNGKAPKKQSTAEIPFRIPLINK